jgi:hypothetical protein
MIISANIIISELQCIKSQIEANTPKNILEPELKALEFDIERLEESREKTWCELQHRVLVNIIGDKSYGRHNSDRQ